ncbi:hypothetical protein PAEPH01_0082 [Pancytospora epiphaga]|nr:hypothetical protein PAEPH01_0082 [Pancytospora epiphaga]
MGSEAEESTDPLLKNDSPKQSTKENEITTEEDNRDKENVIAYSSLNTAEKEALVKKLRREILKDDDSSDNFCFVFFNWIFEQFGINKTAPPSTVLLTNLEYLGEKSETEGLFLEEEDREIQDLYYESMVKSIEPNYKHNEIDVHSLAIAVVKYIKNNVEFVDTLIYKQMGIAYKAGEEKNYMCRRLPFVMNNRSVFSGIKDLLNAIEKNSKKNKLNKEQIREIFSGSVFHWEGKNTEDPLDASQKKELFEDLLKTEFDYVPFEFYN